VPKNLRLVSIHDVLTSRDARSDPTGSRARIKGEPAPEPLHGAAVSGGRAPETGSLLHGWALSNRRAPRNILGSGKKT
jgi:hypothetical protein